jgi:hypothetical protein
MKSKTAWYKRIAPLFILLICITGCNTFKFGWISEQSEVVEAREDNDSVDGVEGPTGGHFDDEGNWIPDNPEIETTYKIPDISSGFIVDLSTFDVSPSIQVEILELDTHIPYVGTVKLDAGIAYQRTYIYIGKLWTSVFEISTGIWGGWNWEDNIPAYGVSITIIRF